MTLAVGQQPAAYIKPRAEITERIDLWTVQARDLLPVSTGVFENARDAFHARQLADGLVGRADNQHVAFERNGMRRVDRQEIVEHPAGCSTFIDIGTGVIVRE